MFHEFKGIFYLVQELKAPEPSDPYYGGIHTGGIWHPIIKLDLSDNTGSKVHIVGLILRYVYSNNSGESFTSPVRLDVPFASSDLSRSQVSIGTDVKVHLVVNGRIT